MKLNDPYIIKQDGSGMVLSADGELTCSRFDAAIFDTLLAAYKAMQAYAVRFPRLDLEHLSGRPA